MTTVKRDHQKRDYPSMTGFAMGRMARGVFPRWRRTAGTDSQYVFAVRFRRSPHWLVIVPGESWGVMGDEEFLFSYAPSNKDARETLERIACRLANGKGE